MNSSVAKNASTSSVHWINFGVWHSEATIVITLAELSVPHSWVRAFDTNTVIFMESFLANAFVINCDSAHSQANHWFRNFRALSTIPLITVLASDAGTVISIISSITLAGLTVPLGVFRAFGTNRNTALSNVVPSVTRPTVFVIGTFSTVPCHRGWANSTHSWLKLKELFITHTLDTIEFTVVWAVWNRNWDDDLFAKACFLIHNKSTLTNASLTVEVLISFAFWNNNADSLNSFTAGNTEAILSDWVIDFVVFASWWEDNLDAFSCCVSGVPTLADACLTVEDFVLASFAFNAGFFISAKGESGVADTNSIIESTIGWANWYFLA